VAKHGPDRQIPTAHKARNRLHQQVAPVLRQDPEFQARHEPFRTNLARAMELVAAAIRRKIPCGVVVCDAWSLAAAVVRVVARRRKAWVSLLNTNRLLETASFQLRDINGWAMTRPGPPSAGAALVPLLPAHASRPVTGGAHTSWCFTRRVRLPGLGQVRRVVRCETAQLTGRSVVLVANRVDWSAAQIIGLYWPRGPPETFSQDSKGPVGCHASRMRRAEAMGKHGCLVCVASALWHRTCRPAVPDRTTHLIQAMGDACRPPGRAVLQQLLVFVHDRLSSGATVDHVFASLFAKKRGIVAA
jgi:hypothetical protein